MNEGIRDFLKQELKKTFHFIAGNIRLADESYVKWEQNGGVDLPLSAFKLTNRQMFWLSVAHRYATKYQINLPESFEAISRLQNKYMHVINKNEKGFREAFNCDEMTEDEEEMFYEYVDENARLRGIS